MSKRFRPSTRRLNCELLEERKLLTALVSSFELPPSPVEVVRASTHSFIDRAIEDLTRDTQEKPIATELSTEDVDTQEGPLSVSKFVIEMGVESNGSAEADGSSSFSTTRSLIFTFTVYPDNSISFRATVSPSPRAAFPTLSVDKLTRFAAMLRFTPEAALPTSLLVSTRHISYTAPSPYEEALKPLTNELRRNAATAAARPAFQVDTVAAELFSVVQEVDPSEPASFELCWGGPLSKQAKPRITAMLMLEIPFDASPASSRSALEADRHAPPQPQAVLADSSNLPVPDGMIALADSPPAGRSNVPAVVNASASQLNASAMFQVFINSVDSTAVALAPRESPEERLAGEPREPTAGPLTPARSATLVAVGFGTWLVLGKRKRQVRYQPVEPN